MRVYELDRLGKRALADLTENVALLNSGEKVSFEVMQEAVERFYDATDAKEAYRVLGVDDPEMSVDELLKKVRTDRSTRMVARLSAGLKSGLYATGKTLARGTASVLKVMGSACQKGSESLSQKSQ